MGRARDRRAAEATAPAGRVVTVVIATWSPIPRHLPARLVANFAARVDVSGGPDACWEWTGARLAIGGYGVVPTGARANRARSHRIALEIKLGRPIQPGMLACHHCDNPPCCNPAHLYEGTHKQNTADMIARGRHRHAVLRGDAHPTRFHPGMNAGEHNGRHVLTEAAVREIRTRRDAGERLDVLATEFGVSDVAIAYAANGRTWSHVA